MRQRPSRLLCGMLLPMLFSCHFANWTTVALCIFFGLTCALFDRAAAKKDPIPTLSTKGDPISIPPESTESVTGWQQEGKDNGSQGEIT